MRFVLVSGLSGSGKSTALRALDDAGFFVTDNLPPQMWLEHSRLARLKGIDKLAVCTDARTHLFFEGLEACLDALAQETPFQLLFLEASNDVLLSRYNLTRRAHPLGELSLFMDFRREHEILAPLRERADIVLDTTALGSSELLERVKSVLLLQTEFHLGLSSFGFKHAPPRDADLVLDVRGMPNPHYVPTLKPRTGLDEEVAAYVFRGPRTESREPKTQALAWLCSSLRSVRLKLEPRRWTPRSFTAACANSCARAPSWPALRGGTPTPLPLGVPEGNTAA